jgi:signal peptidase I
MSKLQEIFPNSKDSQIWFEDGDLNSDSNVLLNVTTSDGEISAFISKGKIVQLEAGALIEASIPRAEVKDSAKLEFVRKSLSISGYAIAMLLLVFSLFSFTGVVKARIVLTGSMAPAINTGDVIFTTPANRKTPVIGDVIAYQAKRFNGDSVAVFSHRIVGGDIDSGFIVKGDSNKTPDTQRPMRGDILGVVIFVIPYIGNLLTPKALFLLVPCIFGFWLILDAMKNVE